MNADDQSFASLMELCGSHFAKRPRTDIEERSLEPRHTRKGPNKHSRSSDSDLDEGSNLVTMLAKLTLRQEDQLNQLNLDRTFISLSSRKRPHTSSDVAGLKGLLACQEGTRGGHDVTSTIHVQDGVRGACRSGNEIAFRFKRPRIDSGPTDKADLDISHAKTLKASSRDPISSEAASALIHKVHKLADQPDRIHRFSALKPMPQDQISKDAAMVVRLDLSLRGTAAQELHETMVHLTGSGLIQLILIRIRPSNLQYSPLAQAIASRLALGEHSKHPIRWNRIPIRLPCFTPIDCRASFAPPEGLFVGSILM